MDWNRKYFELMARLAARICGSATGEDELSLDQWRKEEPRNEALFRELSDPAGFENNRKEQKRFPAEEGWRRIEKKLKVRGWGPGRMGWWKYAAIAVLCLSLGGIYLMTRQREQVRVTVLSPVIFSGTQGARLTLGDGRVVEVTKEKEFTIAEKDGTLIRKDSAGIDYRQAGPQQDSIVYNQMETLTGMEYALTLADGTRVYLNAESRLRFPVTFRGSQRIVELNGEAYFKVAKDADHPFIVRTGRTEVKVLGTSFNIRSYADEPGIITTLVEGKVEMNGQKMKPGEQAVYSRADGLLSLNRVEVEQYIAWQQGRFVFRNERLEDVMKTLVRWYGAEYHFLEESVKEVRIGASFGRYEDMGPIIDMLKKTGLVEVLQADHCVYISAGK